MRILGVTKGTELEKDIDKLWKAEEQGEMQLNDLLKVSKISETDFNRSLGACRTL